MSAPRPVRRLQHDITHYRADQKKVKTDRASEKQQLGAIQQQQQQQIDTFGMPDPLLTAQAKSVRERFDRMITGDQKHVKADHKKALHDLKPAEFESSLKATNRFRHALGLHAIKHQLFNTHTVKGCAQFLLHSKNVSFWSGLSTGSDRKNMERLARGEKAFVPATGGHVKPKLNMMRALVAMAKRGHIMINALTGGHHTTNSNHYRGAAVDLDLSTGNHSMIERVARKFGGQRNFETSHIHLDF